MATVFTYTIASEGWFPNFAVDPPRFSLEIRASAITKALDSVLVAGGNCVVTFKADLSAGEEAALEALVFAHSGAPIPPVMPKLREDGVAYAVPKPSSFGLVMCDRDMRINTCIVAAADAVEDLKMDTSTNKEVAWDELTLVGVYKNVNGTMTLCTTQGDADSNGVLSVWDYTAKLSGDPLLYEMRDGMLYVDPALPTAEGYAHRAYAVVAPTIPPSYGGSIAVFDAYLGSNPDNLIAALSPQATVLDPAGEAGAAGAVVRLYIVHPAGSKLSHVLRLVTYRAPGTF